MNEILTERISSSDCHPRIRQEAAYRLNLFLWSAAGAFLICLFSALGWSGEEPNKVHTCAVSIVLWLAASGLILTAAERTWITCPGLWMLTFGIKTAVGLTITYFAWYEPLAPDLLRVQTNVVGLQDSNLYDYYAFSAAQGGLTNSWALLNFTWLSFGVTGYIALIYKVCGYSIAYVSMCNSLLSLIGLIMLSGTMNFVLGIKRAWATVAFAGLIPSLAFYEATPAKEPLTNALYYGLLFAIARLFWRRHPSFKTCFASFWVFAALAVVRANVVFIVIVSNAWPVIRRLGIFRTLLIALISLGAAAGLLVLTTGSTKALTAMLDINDHFRQTQGFVEERAEAGEGGLKQLIAEKLAPTGIIDLAALSPLRAAIWFYLPYPFLMPSREGITLPPTLNYDQRLTKVRAIHDQCFVLTGWLLLAGTPFLLGGIWAALRHQVQGLEILVANLLGSSLVIGNLMFIMGRRYRTLIEPLVMAIVVVSIHHNIGRRLAIPIYTLMIGGVAVLAVLR